MAATVFKNIGSLVNTRRTTSVLAGAALGVLPRIHDAFLVVEDGLIQSFGTMHELPEDVLSGAGEVIDINGAMILPAWCDSHSHLVFGKSREKEFIQKIKGLTYQEIAESGGGILNSALHLRQLSETQLFENALLRLHQVIGMGTGALEIKSGYGLSLDAELKMLRVIRKLQSVSPIPIKATFLGAHAIPTEYANNRRGYIDLVVREMIPRVKTEGLADYIDVFCETGFFNPAETEEILTAAIAGGLIPKIHANQFSDSGAIEVAIRTGALSVDHLEVMGDVSIEQLSRSVTIGVLLPAAAFFLRLPPPPASQMIEAGCKLALASDFNPGSCPSGNMNLVVALACIQMKMLPEEAINAATINGAYAMGLEQEVGSFTAGKRANFIQMKKIPSLEYIPYAFGDNLIDKVYINGEVYKGALLYGESVEENLCR